MLSLAFLAKLSGPAWAWIELLAWLVGALAAGGAVGLLWGRILLPLARRTKTGLDVAILDATRAPARWVAFAAVLDLGSEASFARVPQVLAHPLWRAYRGALYVALVIGLALAAFAVAHVAMAWYSRRLAARAPDASHSQFAALFQKLATFVFVFIVLTVILEHFDVQITGLLATAGVASLAVAFAAQETLANTIAGFVLMIDRPFKVGDRVQLTDGQMGDVLAIGLRSTEILSFDNTVITIPNAQVAKSQIVNLNAPDAQVKIRCNLGVAYGSDLRKVKAILLDIMTGHPEVLKTPPPAVYFTAFGDSALNLLFVCWVADYRERFRILDELNMAIKDRFEADSVEIPFPQRVVHLRGAEPQEAAT